MALRHQVANELLVRPQEKYGVQRDKKRAEDTCHDAFPRRADALKANGGHEEIESRNQRGRESLNGEGCAAESGCQEERDRDDTDTGDLIDWENRVPTFPVNTVPRNLVRVCVRVAEVGKYDLGDKNHS